MITVCSKLYLHTSQCIVAIIWYISSCCSKTQLKIVSKSSGTGGAKGAQQ